MKFMLKKTKSIIIFLMIALIAVVPTASFAQPQGKIMSIKKNQKAPFAGTLFDVNAAADLTLRLENHNRQCEIKITKELGLCNAKCKLDVDIKVAELEALTKRHVDILKIKNDQIDFLQKVATRNVPWYKTNKFWFSAGILTGLAVSIGSAYAWGQVAK